MINLIFLFIHVYFCSLPIPSILVPYPFSCPWIFFIPFIPFILVPYPFSCPCIIEAICRDGNAALNIPIRPDGSLDEACVTMLEELGRWMKVNGEVVYGNKAWTTPGEGEMVKGKLKKFPGGKLEAKHANVQFDAQDIRFTVGKNGSLYAFTMALPAPGQALCIHSLSTSSGKPVRSVRLLGSKARLQWQQTSEGLTVHCPQTITGTTSLVFRID